MQAGYTSYMLQMQACLYLSIKLINDIEDVLLLPAVAGPILLAKGVIRLASLLQRHVPASGCALILDAPLVRWARFRHHTFVPRLAGASCVVLLVFEG